MTYVCHITYKGWVPATHSNIIWRWETTLSPWVSCIAGLALCKHIDPPLQTDLYFAFSFATEHRTASLLMNVFFFFHAIVFPEKPMVMSSTLLYTSCPDCLVLRSKYPTATGVLNALQLLSKTFDTLTWWITWWSDLQVSCYFWERGRWMCFKMGPSLCLVNPIS